MYINFVRNIFCIAVVSVTLICCNNDKNGGNVELHPQENLMPYSNVEPVNSTFEPLPSEKSDIISAIPAIVKKLHAVINSGNYENAVTVNNILPGDSENILTESLHASRMVLLDTRKNSLYDINLNEPATRKIAEFGRGPGELSHSSDLYVNKSLNLVYVIMQDGRIASFHCSSYPCKKEKEYVLREFSPYSGIVLEDKLVALGMQPVTNNNNKEKSIITHNSIYVFDKKGQPIHSAGTSYDTNGQWMLIRPFTEGIIRKNADLYLVGFHRLSDIFVFNNGFEFTKKYRIPDFKLGKQKFWPDEGRLNIVMEDHSSIKKLLYVKDGWTIIHVVEKSNMRKEEYGFVWDKKAKFYALNIENDQGYYIGEINYQTEKRMNAISLMRDGFMIIKDGKLMVLK